MNTMKGRERHMRMWQARRTPYVSKHVKKIDHGDAKRNPYPYPCGIALRYRKCADVTTRAAIQDEAGQKHEFQDELKQLKQMKSERAGKYVAKVAGTETPEWNKARVIGVVELLPGLKEVTLEIETSRELISLRNSYCAVGKMAQIKVRGSEAIGVLPTTPPFSLEAQRDALLKLRGDLRAGQTKLPEEPIRVKEKLSILVTKDEEDAYNLTVDSEEAEESTLQVEVGPFIGNGLNLKGPIQSIFQYPIVLLFAEGQGIATAKALIESAHTGEGLDLDSRQEVRLYYKVPNEDSVCFEDVFSQWEEKFGIQTVVHTSSFLDAFDDDDTLEYEPNLTAAISFGDEESEEAVNELCEEAEITLHIPSSAEKKATIYADTGGVV